MIKKMYYKWLKKQLIDLVEWMSNGEKIKYDSEEAMIDDYIESIKGS